MSTPLSSLNLPEFQYPLILHQKDVTVVEFAGKSAIWYAAATRSWNFQSVLSLSTAAVENGILISALPDISIGISPYHEESGSAPGRRWGRP
jgi:hypothetical protein